MDEQGLNDAAIMLMSLGEEEAAEVFKHFSPKEVQKLGETIARMRTVPRQSRSRPGLTGRTNSVPPISLSRRSRRCRRTGCRR